ncbi:hypothetical protein NQT69_02410 [Pseudoalteromonas shioyasakiensis]|uniref:hypothetical protein n=1 Tax=Pseudoalteromonas shioyasakiensis TaxID=1190813 RepID=UPI0021187EE6|nr:hypothetical protein [Pseudoalteromonas shioyasakiensis]MCQ8876886.1 hypothetical protein [Pseudoalteromonas shioyasakiensis]
MSFDKGLLRFQAPTFGTGDTTGYGESFANTQFHQTAYFSLVRAIPYKERHCRQ